MPEQTNSIDYVMEEEASGPHFSGLTLDAPRRPFVIGVSGGSASGKTAVCDMIIQQLHGHRVVLINQDSFYHGLTPEESDRVHEYNFDHPDAFDTEQLLDCAQQLRNGLSYRVPIYDFKKHRRSFESCRQTCSNCLVVGMHRYGSTICTLKHGDETWREDEFDDIETNGNNRKYLFNIVVLNGLHYFMCDNRDMVVFNLKNDVEGQFPNPQIWPSVLKRRSDSLREEDFLVEVDGRAIFVSVSPNGGEISIYKWNDLEKDWELMKGGAEFGAKQMFLSKRVSFMEKIDDVGGMGNIIFLPMIDDAKAGVFYSLTTKRYHTFYSGYSSKLPYDVDQFPNGIWVKSDKKIVGQNNLKWFI